MNGTGVLKVYLVQSKKIAYRLHYIRALAQWILEAMKDIDPGANIGFEVESQEYECKLNDMIEEIKKSRIQNIGRVHKCQRR